MGEWLPKHPAVQVRFQKQFTFFTASREESSNSIFLLKSIKISNGQSIYDAKTMRNRDQSLFIFTSPFCYEDV